MMPTATADIYYITIGAESLGQPAKRVVAGQLTGLPGSLNNVEMPLLPGANSSNTIVVASGC